jgi:arylsulfatase A-like enzyme
MNHPLRKLGVLLLASAGFLTANAKKNPNIIFILADDLGYGDVSCLNPDSKIKTPNIDRIAEQGIRFTDAHSSSAVCTPTRYGILTGRYNWRSTLKQGVLNGYSESLIPSTRTTMASMLRQQGYRTACIGKWHLGWNWQLSGTDPEDVDFSLPIKNGPVSIGFDYFFGISASLDMPPYVYVGNDRVTSLPDRQTEGNNIRYGEKGYDGSMWRKGPTGSDFRHSDCLPVLTDRAVKFIHEQTVSGMPYFLYFALPAPHTPILPLEAFSGKSGLNPYGDFVQMVDAKVGEILDAVQKSGENDNTLIVFTSDNGCAPWADYETLLQKGHNPSYIYRGTKADLYDGGHRIPCLVQWPGKIKRAFTVDQTICLTDFMRTFAEISGYAVQDNEAEDSFSLLPALLRPGYGKTIREATVHHSINGYFSIRKGDWKLLFSPGSGGWSHPTPGKEEEGLPPVQLYNVKEDPSEKVNVWDQYPEVVSELKSLMKKYIEEGRSRAGEAQQNDGPFPWKQLEGIL